MRKRCCLIWVGKEQFLDKVTFTARNKVSDSHTIIWENIPGRRKY